LENNPRPDHLARLIQTTWGEGGETRLPEAVDGPEHLLVLSSPCYVSPYLQKAQSFKPFYLSECELRSICERLIEFCLIEFFLKLFDFCFLAKNHFRHITQRILRYAADVGRRGDA